MDVVARWPGSVHHQRIFNNSRIKSRLEARELDHCLILGDSGYEDKFYLITPLLHTFTESERLYNESQIRTRNVIERAFGVLKARFPVLSVGLRCSNENIPKIIHAVTIVHNLAVQQNTPVLPPEVTVDMDEGNIDVPRLALGDDSARRDLTNQYFHHL